MYYVIVTDLPMGCLGSEFNRLVGPFTTKEAADDYASNQDGIECCEVCQLTPPPTFK